MSLIQTNDHDVFAKDNQDKALIEVNSKLTTQIVKYLKSDNEQKTKVFLKKARAPDA